MKAITEEDLHADKIGEHTPEKPLTFDRGEKDRSET